MTTLRKAAEQVLKAAYSGGADWRGFVNAMDALRAALAEPMQEPVAWRRLRDGKLAVADGGNFGTDWMPLYTAPPQRKPLTEEEVGKVAAPYYGTMGFRVEAFARAIERAHGIGNDERGNSRSGRAS